MALCQFERFNPACDLLNERHFSRRFWQMQSVQLPGSIHVITNVTDHIRYLINLSENDHSYCVALKKLKLKFAVQWTIVTTGEQSPWTPKQTVITKNFYIMPNLLVCECLSMHLGKVASFSCYSSVNAF